MKLGRSGWMRTVVTICVGTAAMAAAPIARAAPANPYYVGGSMTFASYMKDRGYVYKENNVPTDPFLSLKNHGANIVRLEDKFGPYENSYTPAGVPADWPKWSRVSADAKHAKAVGLNTFLTFTFNSLGDPQPLANTVPAEWANLTVAQLEQQVYNYTYSKLNELGQAGALPKFVSIGNEVNGAFLAPAGSPTSYHVPSRDARLMNAGYDAVRAVSQLYNAPIKTVAHIAGPDNVGWWMQQYDGHLGDHVDVLALSYYPGWHSMNEWSSWKQLVDHLRTQYDKEMMVLETAASWRTTGAGAYDNHTNIYQNPLQSTYDSAAQKQWLTNLSLDVINAGGLGAITWGGDWTAANSIVVYPDQYGPGSSWENNAFWDRNGNVHAGIDWAAAVHTALPEPGSAVSVGVALAAVASRRSRAGRGIGRLLSDRPL